MGAPNAKKVVHKVTTVGQESARPTMKVAARKRSPILAVVSPILATAAPAKQLAGSYAARLTAIKAAKAAEASKHAAPATWKVDVVTEPIHRAKTNLSTK